MRVLEITFTLLKLWEPELQVHLNQSEVAHSILNLFRFVGPRFVSTCVPNGRSPECLLKKAWDCLIQAELVEVHISMAPIYYIYRLPFLQKCQMSYITRYMRLL